MMLRIVLFSTVCLSYFTVPVAGTNLLAAAAAAKGAVIQGLAGASGGQHVIIHTKPQHVVLEHKPVTLVPVATIPSYSIMDKVNHLWGGVSNLVSTKIQTVGDFFRGPPQVVLMNVDTTKPTTTEKPHKPPVIAVEIVGVPHHRVYPWQMPVAVEDCEN